MALAGAWLLLRHLGGHEWTVVGAGTTKEFLTAGLSRDELVKLLDTDRWRVVYSERGGMVPSKVTFGGDGRTIEPWMPRPGLSTSGSPPTTYTLEEDEDRSTGTPSVGKKAH